LTQFINIKCGPLAYAVVEHAHHPRRVCRPARALDSLRPRRTAEHGKRGATPSDLGSRAACTTRWSSMLTCCGRARRTPRTQLPLSGVREPACSIWTAARARTGVSRAAGRGEREREREREGSPASSPGRSGRPPSPPTSASTNRSVGVRQGRGPVSSAYMVCCFAHCNGLLLCAGPHRCQALPLQPGHQGRRLAAERQPRRLCKYKVARSFLRTSTAWGWRCSPYVAGDERDRAGPRRPISS
jgi:hypothetical protein